MEYVNDKDWIPIFNNASKINAEAEFDVTDLSFQFYLENLILKQLLDYKFED